MLSLPSLGARVSKERLSLGNTRARSRRAQAWEIWFRVAGAFDRALNFFLFLSGGCNTDVYGRRKDFIM